MPLITQEFQRKAGFHDIIGGVAGSVKGTPVPGGSVQVFRFFCRVAPGEAGHLPRKYSRSGLVGGGAELESKFLLCATSRNASLAWQAPGDFFLVEGRNAIPEGMEI
jgi:hypothetical protein